QRCAPPAVLSVGIDTPSQQARDATLLTPHGLAERCNVIASHAAPPHAAQSIGVVCGVLFQLSGQVSGQVSLAKSLAKSRAKSRATPWLGARTIHAPIRRPATRDQRPPGTLKVRSRCIASVSIFMRSRKSRSRCLMPAIVPGSFSRQTRRDQPGVFIRGL